MFFPEKMKRVKVIVLKERSKELMDDLSEMKIIHLRDFKEVKEEYPEDVSPTSIPPKEVEHINRLLKSVNEVLSDVGEGGGVLKDLFSSKVEERVSVESEDLDHCTKWLDSIKEKRDDLKELRNALEKRAGLEERRRIQGEIDQLTKEIRKESRALREVLTNKMERKEIEKKFGQTKNTYILDGWVPSDRADVFRALVKRVSEGAYVEISDPQPGERAPILSKNRIFKPFELITGMFGSPSYDEIDPTPILAITYSIIFGIMFADAFDGLMLILGGYLIRRGGGRRSEGLKDLATILMVLGASATFFGLIMGEFLGGIGIPVGIEGWQLTLTEFEPILFRPFDQPLKMLTFVLWVGVFHLILGITLGVINQLIKRDWSGALLGKASWYLVMLTPFLIYFKGFENLYLAPMAVGLLMVSIKEGFIQGPLELTRLLSNFVSYVRILALNMAHTGVNTVFTLMLSGIAGSLIGYVVVFAFLAFSHVFIVFLVVFSAFAHSLRLHFLEFFSKFYSGEGVKFEPLSIQRRYMI